MEVNVKHDFSERLHRSCLTERALTINGETSETRQIALGVPQGSVLGPLLFNICINSLPKAVEKSWLIMCADDVFLFSTVSTVYFIYHTCTTLHKKNEYKNEKGGGNRIYNPRGLD